MRKGDGESENAKMEENYIEYGYDRHCRCWVVIVFDKDGNELQNEYCGNKEWRDLAIKDFKEKYHTEKVTKIKAY